MGWFTSDSVTSDSSMGINLPQIAVAGLESLAVTKNMTDAAFMTASVGVSNIVPSSIYGYGNDGIEKYIAEPLIAGGLYTLTKYFDGSKQENKLKNFGKAFLVGCSSAVLAVELMGNVNNSFVLPAERSQPRIQTIRKSAPTYTAPRLLIS